ncbi:endonuclease/exonuclease/phosphatase family protein [Frondihabitans australicus]|uniref:Endonuclease/exonuclease/phosphatase family protein n=1 Tax=Frondihabitans australicus TaxID=386892 RepID=A0A495IBU5_9MICO|nr:endonuclease/exonuclease/phosphatase family protein [Frondihabitans australicus]RKR72958.1 endonuclease/exonuclease/phosphatase family protein [Frondihabitans australicus]
MDSDLRIVSYNLREHLAIGELSDLVDTHAMDVLCLQECDSTDIPDEILGLRLAASTKTNRLGLALYYRTDRFELLGTSLYALMKSMHDRVMQPAHERLLAARLRDLATGHELIVADFHAAPLTATNSLRRKQIGLAHQKLSELANGVPTVMVGDFNYPWFRQGLRRHLLKSGYELSITEEPTYSRTGFSGHFDFATTMGMSIGSVLSLPQGKSDHRPILLLASVA